MDKTTCQVSMEEKRNEAVLRMKALGLSNINIESFQKYGRKSAYTDNASLIIKNNLDVVLAAKTISFEQEYNALVYAVIRNETDFGILDSLLYVSDHKDEWEQDRQLLKELSPFAYVYNHTFPAFSEFGTILVRVDKSGHLSRYR